MEIAENVVFDFEDDSDMEKYIKMYHSYGKSAKKIDDFDQEVAKFNSNNNGGSARNIAV